MSALPRKWDLGPSLSHSFAGKHRIESRGQTSYEHSDEGHNSKTHDHSKDPPSTRLVDPLTTRHSQKSLGHSLLLKCLYRIGDGGEPVDAAKPSLHALAA